MPGITSQELIAAARREFAPFYVAGKPNEANLLDSLVVAHAVLVALNGTPREGMTGELRSEFERAMDQLEHTFTTAREEVRCCETFCALADKDQMAIERVLFDVPPPAAE